MSNTPGELSLTLCLLLENAGHVITFGLCFTTILHLKLIYNFMPENCCAPFFFFFLLMCY